MDRPRQPGIFGPRIAPLPLESVDPGHEYQLLRNLSGRKVKEGWEWHSKSELVQLDPRGLSCSVLCSTRGGQWNIETRKTQLYLAPRLKLGSRRNPIHRRVFFRNLLGSEIRAKFILLPRAPCPPGTQLYA